MFPTRDPAPAARALSDSDPAPAARALSDSDPHPPRAPFPTQTRTRRARPFRLRPAPAARALSDSDPHPPRAPSPTLCACFARNVPAGSSRASRRLRSPPRSPAARAARETDSPAPPRKPPRREPPPRRGSTGVCCQPGSSRHEFTLTDQHGRRVSLSGFRGDVVILAFLYSTSRATAPLIAQQIRGAVDELEPHNSAVRGRRGQRGPDRRHTRTRALVPARELAERDAWSTSPATPPSCAPCGGPTTWSRPAPAKAPTNAGPSCCCSTRPAPSASTSRSKSSLRKGSHTTWRKLEAE